jgi:phosphatidylglycerophosphate synthase
MLEKVVKKLFFKRISANQMTFVALILGLLSALSIFLSGILTWKIELIILAGILMFISFLFDAIDGTLARLEGATAFGGVLDIFCDRTVEIFIIISLISTDPITLMWPGIFSLGAIILCISMFLLIGGVINEENLVDAKKVIYYHHGLMERTETFIFLILSTFLVVFRFLLLWIFSILVFLTAVLRLRDAYILLNKNS